MKKSYLGSLLAVRAEQKRRGAGRILMQLLPIMCVLTICVAVLAGPALAGFKMSMEEFAGLCKTGSARQVQNAIKNGVDWDTGALFSAAQNPDAGVIAALLEAGTFVDVRGVFVFQSPSVRLTLPDATALMVAAGFNTNPEVVDALLKAGADVNIRNEDGKRAVDYAWTNENLRNTATLERLEEASGVGRQEREIALERDKGIPHGSSAAAVASGIIHDLRSLKAAALMFWADNMNKLKNSNNLADVVGTPEKLKAALGRYVDNPEKYGNGQYVFETDDKGSKWFVGFKLDDCGGAIREKLGQKAKQAGLLKSKKSDDPYDGKANIVYMLAR